MLGELTRAEIDTLLRDEVVGRIGVHTAGRVYVVPVTFAYANGEIYAHSGEGQKLRMMRANPSVCFEVDRMRDLANWESVIVYGAFEELRGADAERGLRLLIQRLTPLVTGESSTPSHGLGDEARGRAEAGGHHAIVYRIHIDEVTGRYERR